MKRCTALSLLLLPLLVLLGVHPARAQAQPAGTVDTTALEERLTLLAPGSAEAARISQSLLAIDPDVALHILEASWPRIASPEARLYLLNTLQEHPRVLDILHLGATDSSLFVQNRALQALEMYSFESFTEDFSAYELWRSRQKGRSLEEIMRQSCREYVAGVNRLEDAQRLARLPIVQRVAYGLNSGAHYRERRRAMLDSGLPEALAQWVNSPTKVWTAFAVLRAMKMDEAYLRRVVLPLTDPKTDAALRRQAVGVLATPDNRWAVEPLLKMFVAEYPDPEADNLGYALIQFGDARALPTLIGMMDSDRSQDGQRALGNLLNLLSGITTGQLHDAAWWHSWWTRNAKRFPADVASRNIPVVAVRARRPVASGASGPEQHQVAGDIKRTYWLIVPPALQAVEPLGQQRPAAHAGDSAALGLLVVLPPDGNGANAALYWQQVAQISLKGRYLVAVATAPVWSANQPAVWITSDKLSQVKEARFGAERFAAEIAQDVAATHAVRPDRVYLHGAMESGPAVYACALDETTPFKGFYVLASTFRSAGLPPLARAKNRRLLIQHSADDKSAPYLMASAAQKVLTEHGATVKLDTYKGAHGYVFTDQAADPIQEAIAWLEGPTK